MMQKSEKTAAWNKFKTGCQSIELVDHAVVRKILYKGDRSERLTFAHGLHYLPQTWRYPPVMRKRGLGGCGSERAVYLAGSKLTRYHGKRATGRDKVK